MSIIYLMRHAQSEGNADTSLYITKGNENLELTTKGEQQASEAANTIRNDICKIPSTGMSIISSPFIRAMRTSQIIKKEAFNNHAIKVNALLCERNHGEQERCANIDNFDERPVERIMYEKLGHLFYKPLRGESLMDVQIRAGLFMTQYDRFRHIPVAVIVSHRDFCHMLHAFLTGEMPTPASSWKNCEIRKYQAFQPSSLNSYQYEGKLNHSPETSTV